MAPPAETKSLAVRSYLKATIIPSLLKALMELDKEEYTSSDDEDLKCVRSPAPTHRVRVRVSHAPKCRPSLCVQGQQTGALARQIPRGNGTNHLNVYRHLMCSFVGV